MPTYAAIVGSQWNGPEHCMRSGADPQDTLSVCLGLRAGLTPSLEPVQSLPDDKAKQEENGPKVEHDRMEKERARGSLSAECC